MVKQQYPRVEIKLNALRENVEAMVRRCGERGIGIAGVIKGATGIPECALAYEKGGAVMIASSRLEQLEDARSAGVRLPLLLLRVPMLSEAEEVIRLTDLSLNSDPAVLASLNRQAQIQGKEHKVILMADLGDLREGFWDKEEMIRVAEWVENSCSHLRLGGV